MVGNRKADYANYISRVQISENLGENYRFSGENSRKNPKGAEKRKSLQTAKTACRLSFLAEWVGFEPTVPEGTTDFEFYEVLARNGQFCVSFRQLRPRRKTA